MISPVYSTPSHRPDLNAAVGAWVSLRCFGDDRGFDKFSSMAVFDGDQLIAGTIFHGWHDREGVLELSSAAVDKRWLTGPVIRCMFRYPFDEMGAQLAVLRVSDRNEPMLGIARRFGFEMTHIPRLRGRDEGEYICALTEEAWRRSPVYRRGQKR